MRLETDSHALPPSIIIKITSITYNDYHVDAQEATRRLGTSITRNCAWVVLVSVTVDWNLDLVPNFFGPISFWSHFVLAFPADTTYHWVKTKLVLFVSTKGEPHV
jgi:hypothetical protein